MKRHPTCCVICCWAVKGLMILTELREKAVFIFYEFCNSSSIVRPGCAHHICGAIQWHQWKDSQQNARVFPQFRASVLQCESDLGECVTSVLLGQKVVTQPILRKTNFAFVKPWQAEFLYLSYSSAWHLQRVIQPRPGTQKGSTGGRRGWRPSLTLTHVLPWCCSCTVLFIAPVKANSYQTSLGNDR